MLNSALMPLKQDLFKILTSDDAKKAFENALKTTFPADAQECSTTQEIAKNFGDIAASYLGALAGPLGDAIHKYVSDIEITLTPKGLISTSILSPSPVTGMSSVSSGDIKVT